MSLCAYSGLVLALSASSLHPLSVSSSRLSVDGRHARLELRCQATTLIEVVAADGNVDGKLDAAELEQARDAVEGYVLDRYHLIANSSIELSGRLVSLAAFEQSEGRALAADPQVDIRFDFEAREPLTMLRVESSLFQDADPWHRDQSEIVWNGAEHATRLVWIEDPVWVFEPAQTESKSVVAQYVRVGVEHILTGYDHIAFLVALIVASRRVRSLLAVVTAFTIAHSVSLACAATGLIEVSPRIVEPLIALSIAFVAVRNIFDRKERRLWPEAFAFGLVHGLGFAGSVADTLAGETAKLAALFGFNLGVELGQLAIVLVAVAALRALSLHAPELARPMAPGIDSSVATPPIRFAPRWIRVSASSVVGVLGLYWFITRLG